DAWRRLLWPRPHRGQTEGPRDRRAHVPKGTRNGAGTLHQGVDANISWTAFPRGGRPRASRKILSRRIRDQGRIRGSASSRARRHAAKFEIEGVFWNETYDSDRNPGFGDRYFVPAGTAARRPREKRAGPQVSG